MTLKDNEVSFVFRHSSVKISHKKESFCVGFQRRKGVFVKELLRALVVENSKRALTEYHYVKELSEPGGLLPHWRGSLNWNILSDRPRFSEELINRWVSSIGLA